MVQVLLEAILEAVLQAALSVAVRLPGYWFIRCFCGTGEVDVTGNQVAVVGFLLWLFVGSVVAILVFFLRI